MASFSQSVLNEVVSNVEGLIFPGPTTLGIVAASCVKYYYSRSFLQTGIVATSSLLGNAIGQGASDALLVPDVILFYPMRASNLASTATVFAANQYLAPNLKESAIISGANYVGSVTWDLLGMIF
jgi:hypothetical protein